MLTRYYDPFEQFNLISDSLFKDFFKTIKSDDVGKGFPVYDMRTEEDGTVVLEFPLAGYKKEELSITVEKNKLCVCAAKDENSGKGQKYIARRSFEKYLTARDDLDLENLEASFEDGLLTLTISQRPTQKPEQKKIEIKSTLKALNK